MTCRFVVKPGTPIPDCDELLQSESILRTIAPATDCPICLEQATVPRMLSCGHIMCLACYFRFLRRAAERVCPLCYDHVPAKVTSVSFLPSDANLLPQIGAEIELKLMAKPASGLPYQAASQGQKLSVSQQVEFSRFVWGTAQYCRDEAHRELTDLKTAKVLAMELDEPEGFDEAIAEVRKDLASGGGLDDAPHIARPKREPPAFFYYQSAHHSPTTYVLAPLDITILKQAYGNYADFPATLTAKVDNINFRVVDDDIRRRMKFLNHVPSGAPLALMECDWRGVLPADVVKNYSKQLALRRNKRKNKDRKDERRRQEADVLNDARMRAEVLVDVPTPPAQQIDLDQLPTLGLKPVQATAKKAVWVDPEAEFREIMEQAYIPKRGRRKIVISSNH